MADQLKRPKFDATTPELNLIERITERAMAFEEKTLREEGYTDRQIARKLGNSGDRKMTWHMDLLAAHNSNPLRLQDMVSGPDFDFVHDVFGIRRHLNRETGELGDCFSPRFSRRGTHAEAQE